MNTKKIKTKGSIIGMLVILVVVTFIAMFLHQNRIDDNTDKNALVVQHSYLLKTKLALIEYVRLEESDLDYETLKGQAESRFISSHESGLQHLNVVKSSDNPSNLTIETERVYSVQIDILNKEEGEIIDHLVVLSNLLREYQLQIEKDQ